MTINRLHVCHQSSSIQLEAWQQRITGNDLGILQNNHFLIRSVDIHSSLERIDQPAQRRAVFYVFHHLVAKLRKRSVGDLSSTTKSGQNGAKPSFCSFVRRSHFSRLIHDASGDRLAPFGNANIVEESKQMPLPSFMVHASVDK